MKINASFKKLGFTAIPAEKPPIRFSGTAVFLHLLVKLLSIVLMAMVSTKNNPN